MLSWRRQRPSGIRMIYPSITVDMASDRVIRHPAIHRPVIHHTKNFVYAVS